MTTEEAQSWCMENGDYPYLETSAKDDTNVTVAFEEAVRQVLAVEEQLEHCGMLGHTIDLNSGSKAGFMLLNVGSHLKMCPKLISQ